ncbi:MAG: trigger factor [Christensenella sp.]|nr:trigger factor [Christensenella sp.]
MSYTKEILEKNQVKLTFDVSEEDWKAAIQQAYEKNKGKFTIEGFRKGHVPRSVIEKRYGIGVFFDDALDIILPKEYEAALKAETDIFPVDQPDVAIVAISDSTLKFTATITVKPEVKLGAFTGLEFKKDKVKVTAEEIKAEVDKALDQAGSWEDITDRACEKGDKVIIDYSGSIDGVKFEGGTAEKQPLELGAGQFIPGFEDQVCGMKIGEDRDITVKFPEDYGAKELAGKEAVFAIKLHEISKKTIPAYDDEFVKDVSEFNTVKEYEADIKKTITERKEKAANEKLENDIIEKIAASSEVDIPECMIKHQAEDMVKEFEYGLMYRGLKADDYYKYMNTTREKLAEQYKDTAKKNVLYRLVLEAVLKQVQVPVSEEEIEEAIAKMAADSGAAVEDFKKNINEQYMNYIRNDITTNKLFEYLKNNNTIK